MSDVVMKEEDRDTLSVKVILLVFQLSYVLYFAFKPGGGYPTTSVDHVGRWSPVVIKLPSTPQDELKRNWNDAILRGVPLVMEAINKKKIRGLCNCMYIRFIFNVFLLLLFLLFH